MCKGYVHSFFNHIHNACKSDRHFNKQKYLKHSNSKGKQQNSLKNKID